MQPLHVRTQSHRLFYFVKYKENEIESQGIQLTKVEKVNRTCDVVNLHRSSRQTEVHMRSAPHTSTQTAVAQLFAALSVAGGARRGSRWAITLRDIERVLTVLVVRGLQTRLERTRRRRFSGAGALDVPCSGSISHGLAYD